MAPIEVFFGVIVIMFAFIGFVRGFLRELGVTLVLMFLLFFLSRFEPQLTQGLTRIMSSRVLRAGHDADLLQCWLYIFVLVAATFVSYQGETLAFGGKLGPGGQAVLLGGLTGMLNGYLFAGSLWYYMDRFDYPIAFLGFTAQGLSPLARGMLEFLPITFLGQPLILGQSLLLYLSGLLLLARVIR